MKTLLIQFEAPVVSFGTVTVDKMGMTSFWPVRSMLTGFFGNALGYKRTQIAELTELQTRLQYAVRCDRPGNPYQDFQTVALTKIPPTETSQGWIDPGRNAQWNSGEGTLIRHPDYWTDVAYLVAVTLRGEGALTLDNLAGSMKRPVRVPYIGRMCCRPTAPYFYGLREGGSLLDTLLDEPELPRGDKRPAKRALWPLGEVVPTTATQVKVVRMHETKDWKNSVHTGETQMREGSITLRGAQCN